MRAAVAMALVLVAPAARADRIDECNAAYEQSQELRLEHKLRASHAQLEICARATCPQAMRTDCATWLRDMSRVMPSVVVVGDRAGATATIDAAPATLGTAVEVDPGHHHVVMSDPRTHESTAIDVEIAEGDKNKRVEIHFTTPTRESTSPEKKPGPPWYGWVIGGVGAAGIVSCAAWGTAALVLQNDLRSSCFGHCAPSDVQMVHDRALIADVSLAIGIVGLGVATAIFLWPRSPQRAARLVTTGIQF